MSHGMPSSSEQKFKAIWEHAGDYFSRGLPATDMEVPAGPLGPTISGRLLADASATQRDLWDAACSAR